MVDLIPTLQTAIDPVILISGVALLLLTVTTGSAGRLTTGSSPRRVGRAWRDSSPIGWRRQFPDTRLRKASRKPGSGSAIEAEKRLS